MILYGPPQACKAVVRYCVSALHTQGKRACLMLWHPDLRVVTKTIAMREYDRGHLGPTQDRRLRALGSSVIVIILLYHTKETMRRRLSVSERERSVTLDCSPLELHAESDRTGSGLGGTRPFSSLSPCCIS